MIYDIERIISYTNKLSNKDRILFNSYLVGFSYKEIALFYKRTKKETEKRINELRKAFISLQNTNTHFR